MPAGRPDTTPRAFVGKKACLLATNPSGREPRRAFPVGARAEHQGGPGGNPLVPRLSVAGAQRQNGATKRIAPFDLWRPHRTKTSPIAIQKANFHRGDCSGAHECLGYGPGVTEVSQSRAAGRTRHDGPGANPRRNCSLRTREQRPAVGEMRGRGRVPCRDLRSCRRVYPEAARWWRLLVSGLPSHDLGAAGRAKRERLAQRGRSS